jgi:hypothetical protein
MAFSFEPDDTSYTSNKGYNGKLRSCLPNDFTSQFVTADDSAHTEYILRVSGSQFEQVKPFVRKYVTGGPGLMVVMLKEGVNLRDIRDMCGDDPSVVGPNRRVHLA